MSASTRISLGLCIVLIAAVTNGCGNSRTSYAADEQTQMIGQYNPPPAGAARVKAGVPPFMIQDDDLTQDTAKVAADQLTTLLVHSQRFHVIERTQLEQLLKEQSLEGIVRADELAQAGRVRGVDYIFIGKITNFLVKREERSGGFGVGRVNLPGGGNFGGLDIKKDKVVVTVEVGVDLRMVNPSDGSTVAANFSEFTRTDEVGAFGVDILGASASGDADLQIDEDNKGKLLRFALDDALRKMLPQVDTVLVGIGDEQRAEQGGGNGQGAAAGGDDASKFCAHCGEKISTDSKFCAKCGKQQPE